MVSRQAENGHVRTRGDANGPSRASSTMRDVAELAGVALTTVSRAFSDPGKLAPETLRRIESASANLNYTVNLNARSLRRRSSDAVLVLLPDIANPFFSLVLKGIEEAARESGRVLLVGDTGSDATLGDSYAGQLEARTVDALILLDGRLPFRPGSPARARLLRSPVVAVSERVNEAGVPYVGIDNVAAARDVAHLLADLGHRRVAHIGGPAGNSLTQEREIGFSAGAGERALWLGGMVTGDFSIRSGRDAAAVILSWPDRPTAVFAANDEMAFGAIHAFKAAGLRVPEDMSVVGFDDIAFSEIHDPALTTVRQPRRAMGRTAMAVAAAQIEGTPLPASTVILAHELVLRASAGQAPSAANAKRKRVAFERAPF